MAFKKKAKNMPPPLDDAVPKPKTETIKTSTKPEIPQLEPEVQDSVEMYNKKYIGIFAPGDQSQLCNLLFATVSELRMLREQIQELKETVEQE